MNILRIYILHCLYEVIIQFQVELEVALFFKI